MRQGELRKGRMLLLLLLSASVLAHVFFFSAKFSSSSEETGFVDDISTAAARHSGGEVLQVKSVEKGEWDGVKEPTREILKEDTVEDMNVTIRSFVSGGGGESGRSTGDSPALGGAEGARMIDGIGVKFLRNATTLAGVVRGPNQPSGKTRGVPVGSMLPDEKIREMKDQLIMAKAYLHLAPANSNSHLVRELRSRIKEAERVIGQVHKDSDLSRSALQKKRAMEATLSKAGRVYPDCSAMASKLRWMTHNTEEQWKAQKNHASYLMQLAARTFPKGLHCISMHLTSEYFALKPAERVLPNEQKVKQSNLYHYVIFSDNVLASAVVINSTTKASKDPDKIVFHVVTDDLNYPAMTMWFLTNPPAKATTYVENMDDFKWYNSSYFAMADQPGVRDPRFRSELNYLRFYLPQIFPYLDKVVLLDHDVVVQKDLSRLWKIKMNGKVNGAVEICKNEPDLQLERLANFSNPVIAANFDRHTCLWAFGMNIFDLREWRRQGLTNMYHKWLQLSRKKHILKAGSLPLGQLVFYNKTLPLDRRWHVHGLGYDPDVGRGEIERAAVIHYDGLMKPWLEIGMAKYKGYWTKFLNYRLPYLQQCNIHP